MKKLLTVFCAACILALALAGGASAEAAGITWEKLPEITEENISEFVVAQVEKYVTNEQTTPMLFQGFLEMDIKVGEDKAPRVAKIYVPENNVQGTQFIMMNTPEGVDAETFITESGWKEIAEKEQMPLFLMVPADGVSWGTPEEEAAYVKACFEAEKAGQYLNPGFSRYAIGYGEIGAELQKYVMQNPMTFSAAAYLDASNIPTDELQAIADFCVDDEVKNFGGITLKEFPMPVLIIEEEMDDTEQAVLSFYENAAADPNAADRYSPEGEDLLKAAVVCEEGKADYVDRATTEKIWSHIGQFYRYGNGWLSNSIFWRLDYEKLGVEIRSMTTSDGVDHNFLVYVPEALRGSEEKVPLVLTYHGAGNTMSQQFDNNLWNQLADKEGFIVVAPETNLRIDGRFRSSMVTPSWACNEGDMIYCNELLDLLIAEYPVDETRIYANGHSNGCGETLFLCNTAAGDRFAAVAPTGGLPIQKSTDDWTENRSATIIPTWVFMGEYDLWDYKLDNPDNKQLISGANTILLRTGLATEENVEEVRVSGYEGTVTEDRFNTSIWTNEDGVPLFQYTWVRALGHATKPFEIQAAWYDWLTNYTLDPATGIRTYKGETLIK